MSDLGGMVVVVDDDNEWVETLSDFLLEEGYSVIGASNGLVALDALSRTHPFAVVTDIQMPVMDGRQLLGRLHAEDARLPVIVVTAEHLQDHDASLESAFRVIRKPVPVEDLLSALEAARAQQVAHLSLKSQDVARPRWDNLHRVVLSLCYSVSGAHLVMLTIALASSFALLRHWRGKLS